MDTVLIIKFMLFAGFLSAVALLSAAETAITSLSTLSIRRLKEQFPLRTPCLQFWEEKPNQLLAAILLGTNLAVVGTSVLATSVGADLAARWLLPRKPVLFITAAATIGMTLVLGNILPKIYGRYRAEKLAILFLPWLVAVNRLFRPVNQFLIGVSETVIGIFGKRPTETPFLRPEELKFLLSSEETLPLPTPARHLMKNILDFGKTRVSRVMVPRSEIQAVDLAQDQQKVISQIIEKEFSRVPVYRGNLDNIVGIVYSKDLALAWRGGSLFLVDDLIRPAYFVPGSARIDQVLREFKTGHYHLALVVDEFGSTIGLVTIEDLVEEIVGEIWDEYDIQEKNTVLMPDGSCLVRAAESLAKVADALQVQLPVAEFSTVGGWVLDLFGRIPRAGDRITWGALQIEIVDADKKKILRVKLQKNG